LIGPALSTFRAECERYPINGQDEKPDHQQSNEDAKGNNSNEDHGHDDYRHDEQANERA
jgi:hypothetical protein